MTDLTVGKPWTVLWKFSLPMFVSVIFQQMYSIFDSIIAGKFAGEDALAAVGASYPITMIFMAFAVGSNVGCCVVISQFFGGKEFSKVKTASTTTIISCTILATVLTVFGLAFSTPLMRMINTPDNIFRDGELYLKIYIAGLIFLFLYNVGTGIYNAMGDSKTPLYLLIGSSVGNVVLDYVFVKFFKWGVAGVAWATFIAQGVACVFSLLILVKKTAEIKTEDKPPLFSGKILKKITLYSIPSILQQSFVSFGNIIIQGLINSFGASITAGYAAAVKLNNLVITSFTTLGNGMSNFTAQNYGAGKIDRIRQGCRAGIKMIWILCVPVVLLYLLAGREAVHLFMDKSTGLAMNTGVQFLRIVVPFYFVVSVKLVSDGVLRGTGCMKQFMIDTFADLILRVGFAVVLASGMGVVGIWCAWPVGWSIGTLLSVYFYKTCKWEEKK